MYPFIKKTISYLSPSHNETIGEGLYDYIMERRKASSFGNIFLALTVFFADLKFSFDYFLSPFGLCFSILILINLLRALLACPYPKRKRFITLTAFNFLSWSGLAFSLFFHKGNLDFQTLILLIILSGVASSSSSVLAPNPLLALFGVTMTVLIPGLYLLFLPNDLLLGLICIVYFIYLSAHSLQLYALLKKHLQQQLDLKNEQTRIINTLDSIPGFFSILSKDLKYILVNRFVIELYKIPLSDFIGKPLGFMGGLDSEFSDLIMNFAKSNKNTFSSRLQIPIEDKSEWHSLHLTKIKESDEIMILALNVQKQVELEEQNLDQKLKLEQSQKMAELGLISGGISHEINNPLAIIIGKLSLLKKRIQKESIDKEQIYTDLEKIEETAHRIVRIIRSIMSFAHPSKSESFSNIKASKLLEDLRDFTYERLKASSITFNIEAPSDLNITCRPTQISQVLVNFIHNARDALSDTEMPEIRVSIYQGDSHIIIKVEDNGPGVSPEIREKILLPFFTTKEPGKGTGLGLSISNSIIKNHNGKIEIGTSEKLGGACFKITIPQNIEAIAI